jgi:hypothetical protein
MLFDDGAGAVCCGWWRDVLARLCLQHGWWLLSTKLWRFDGIFVAHAHAWCSSSRKAALGTRRVLQHGCCLTCRQKVGSKAMLMQVVHCLLGPGIHAVAAEGS